MPDPYKPTAQISRLFLNHFQVDENAPFKRHLNRLEVEIAREDYRQMKRVELVEPCPTDDFFSNLVDLTGRLLKTSQNNYNCQLLKNCRIRVYLDRARYQVYYRMPDRCISFIPSWRNNVLQRFFGEVPLADTDWHNCGQVLTGFRCKYLADNAGGALLLEGPGRDPDLPLLTVSHGLYDPHTLEVALYFLRYNKGRGAMINLGFSGREPLTDDNLQKLKAWGVPLNPSNIDVIYPYVDDHGHPNCYKHEESLCRYVGQLEKPEPQLIIDVHGYVGTHAHDERVLVGMGGLPPYPQLTELGEVETVRGVVHLRPEEKFHRGLAMLRELSEEIYVQLCIDSSQCCHFSLLGGLQLVGRIFDPRTEVTSLLFGEERSFLKQEDVRWLPSAGANALQRLQACKIGNQALCLHVEIPTRIRRQIALKMKQQAIDDSLVSSQL
ncbi:MAG: hypothetical protein OQK97_08440 [Deltaproteobacteria bacterium]|nr:hypothetical protein [Deltaproteobacteria bacterium]